MSIDLNWDTLTSGPDGDALAESIRSFIHDKFQAVPLPRFIKSVTVHGFDFGSIPPQLELKDITDPLPDFYEDDDDEDESEDEEDAYYHAHGAQANAHHAQSHERGGRLDEPGARRRPGGLREAALRNEVPWGHGHDMGSPFLGVSTPGILSGTGLNYFQGALGTGTHTPLAAVAGAHLGNNGWLGGSAAHSQTGNTPSHTRHPSQSSVVSVDNLQPGFEGGAGSGSGSSPAAHHQHLPPGFQLREKASVSTLAPTSVGTSRPPTRDPQASESAIVEEGDDGYNDDDDGVPPHGGRQGHGHVRPGREPRVEDVQAVFRIRYAGDVRLNLTAEILLDYPMPSFVGIPLKLNITGLSFDGVGVLAHIRKRVHFCFLSPEDALAAVGPDQGEDDDDNDDDRKHGKEAGREHKPRFGGLLQEVKVESEIGQREAGRQSLKNVDKVERFVLEQVRRIFEEEFVYPSSWTFLV